MWYNVIMSESLSNMDSLRPTNSASATVRLVGSDGIDSLRGDIRLLKTEINNNKLEPDSHWLKARLRRTGDSDSKQQIGVDVDQKFSDESVSIWLHDRALRDLFSSPAGSNKWSHILDSPRLDTVYRKRQGISTDDLLGTLTGYLKVPEITPVYLDKETTKLSIAAGILALKQFSIFEINTRKTYSVADFNICPTGDGEEPYLSSREIALNTGNLSPSKTYTHLAITAIGAFGTSAGIKQKLHYLEKTDSKTGSLTFCLGFSAEAPQDTHSKKFLESIVQASAKQNGENHMFSLIEAVKSLKADKIT